MNYNLRIPCASINQWEAWVTGNPLKLLRYWKFKAKGFSADTETSTFIISHVKNASIVTDDHWLIFKKQLARNSALETWVSAAKIDLGETFITSKLQ